MSWEILFMGNGYSCAFYECISVARQIVRLLNRLSKSVRLEMLVRLPQVMAVRVGSSDRKEAQLQVSEQARRAGIDAAGPGVCGWALMLLEEDVFIAQLTARARLLDAEFQARVLLAVRAHAVPSDAQPTPAFRPSVRSGGEALICSFAGGVTGLIAVHAAPPKRAVRIREKLGKYAAPDPRAVWPLCANILDPVRVSLVCEGAAQMLEVLSWFTQGEAETGLQVCRVKNKFSFLDDEVWDATAPVHSPDSCNDVLLLHAFSLESCCCLACNTCCMVQHGQDRQASSIFCDYDCAVPLSGR